MTVTPEIRARLAAGKETQARKWAEERQALVEDVAELLELRVIPERIAERLGKKPAALARRLYRIGRPDLALPFEKARGRYQPKDKDDDW